jgi:hypothetical protein
MEKHIQQRSGTRESKLGSKTMKIALILLTLVSASSCFLLGDDEVFLLPRGYAGRVLVLLNQQKGEAILYGDRKQRVYEIPDDGILRTQFTPNTASHHPNKYFYVENAQKTEIPYVNDPRQLKSDSIQICCFSFGRGGKSPNVNDIVVEYYEFYVGTKSDIEKAKSNNKTDPVDLVPPFEQVSPTPMRY